MTTIKHFIVNFIINITILIIYNDNKKKTNPLLLIELGICPLNNAILTNMD